MSSSSRPYVIKDISSKAPLHYESRIQRRVEPLQPELKKALTSLEENTSDFIRYNSIGRLGVTLVILDPAVKRIVGTDKKGVITQEAVRHFEDELNENLGTFHRRDSEYPLQDPEEPLALYSDDTHKDRLAIKLATADPRLRGERLLAEEYIQDTYPEVSDRFGKSNQTLTRMEPHVTIGTIQEASLDREDYALLQKDPSGFMLRTAFNRMRDGHIEFDMQGNVEPIIFPESLSLGGIHVVCQQR